MKLIWIVDLAKELGVYKGTVRRWEHSTSNYKPGNNKTGQGFGGKRDVNYHWRKGFPTRISYGGFR